MFKNPFSFEGRIHRAEYGLTILLFTICVLSVIILMIETHFPVLFATFFIPLLWFCWAQSAKRCHDLGKSGWWQIIPFYVFILLLVDGQSRTNQYGYDPRSTGSLLEDFISE
jgi:uncharacterized membrane protein YhaH (DUF805 family)